MDQLYFFEFANIIEKAVVGLLSLDKNLAKAVVSDMSFGSAKLLDFSEKATLELRHQVSSP